MPKTLIGGPFVNFQHPFCRKTFLKMKVGGPIEIFPKKVA